MYTKQEMSKTIFTFFRGSQGVTEEALILALCQRPERRPAAGRNPAPSGTRTRLSNDLPPAPPPHLPLRFICDYLSELSVRRTAPKLAHSGFVIRISFGLRISAFGFYPC